MKCFVAFKKFLIPENFNVTQLNHTVQFPVNFYLCFSSEKSPFQYSLKFLLQWTVDLAFLSSRFHSNLKLKAISSYFILKFHTKLQRALILYHSRQSYQATVFSTMISMRTALVPPTIDCFMLTMHLLC